ncbi:MAG: hypothetical protein NUV97_02825 [archaeon]|nr:hypothetical protein [archaeon]MCR4323819.1 hypothetical protein [Nanoarchaeota archaeon]
MKKENLIIISIFFILAISLVNAAGVAKPYWDEHPLKMFPGETKIINLTLQNMIGEKNLSFIAEVVSDGGGIVKLVQNNLTYFVPLGRYDIGVPIEISVPKEIVYGDTRQIEVSFTQVAGPGGGMVDIVGKLTVKFPIEIVNEENSSLYIPPKELEKKETPVWIWIIAAAIILIALIILIIWLIRRKHGENQVYERYERKPSPEKPPVERRIYQPLLKRQSIPERPPVPEKQKIPVKETPPKVDEDDEVEYTSF